MKLKSKEMKKAQIARCPDCKKVVMASVIPVHKESIKEFAKLMKEGCELTTEIVPEANWEWCNLKCKTPELQLKHR